MLFSGGAHLEIDDNVPYETTSVELCRSRLARLLSTLTPRNVVIRIFPFLGSLLTAISRRPKVRHVSYETMLAKRPNDH